MNDFDNNLSNKNAENKDIESDYEFVQETIKRKPINVKKIVKKVLITVILAVVFGLVATITLVLIYPRIYEKMYPKDDTVRVSLPIAKEDVPEDVNYEPSLDKEASEEITGSDNSEEAIDGDAQVEDAMDESQDVNNTSEDSNVDDAASEEAQDNQVVINQVVEKIEKELELEDYRTLLRKISSVAAQTQKSLVTVSGRRSNKDWFNNSYVDNNSSMGIILADNGKELLIITPTYILNSATFVDVTFNNGDVCSAYRKASDANTGLSVVSVLLDNIGKDTLEDISMAEFGSVAASPAGTPVIAVGAPYDVTNSMAMGQITSNSVIIDKSDSDVRLISTDIYGSTNSTGVLVNYNGRIIGIICHDEAVTDMPNLIRAYSAEDIMPTIEKMSNGSKLACFGIKGTDVTKEANESFGVPKGAYVKEVIVDSPAMLTGIRNGDVITKIGIKSITSFTDFKELMLSSNPGDTYSVTLERPSGSNYIEVNYEVTMEELR